MAADITTLDAHEQPSGYLRSQWKAYSRAPAEEILSGGDIDEVREAGSPSSPFCLQGTLPADHVGQVFSDFLSHDDGSTAPPLASVTPPADVPIYFHPLLPGLLVLPALVPPPVQRRLLDCMLHRDLSAPRHKTNLHLHYDLPYPPAGQSFFSYAPDAGADTDADKSISFVPKDPAVHRPLSIRQVLERRLHWVTLGGQYDWTRRVYPGDKDLPEEERVPPFPGDLAQLLAGLFPDTVAQAAIVNLYTPGDTMMMHRDVSESTDKGLISLSLGCDALFMAAPTREFAAPDDAGSGSGSGSDPDKPKPYILLRLRSGDAIYMSGHARFSWHGVPKVIKGTCPDHLADWPAAQDASEGDDGRYEAWRGWMRNKRVNLNVRQMKD